MSKESAKEFLGRLVDDDEFLERFASLPEGDERRRQAAAEGYDFTTDELREAKEEELAAAGERRPERAIRPPGDIQPLYGVVDTWDA